MIVAIDGPAGAGKSTTARSVAEALGFAHLDTGAMYRALTVAALDRGLDLEDRAALDETVAVLDVGIDDNHVELDGIDVSARIRDPDVTEAVARVAARPAVRAALVPLQRRLAAARDTVVEGRDIGTVVFPDADVKVYLTAAPAERARRRTKQLGLDDDERTVAELADDMATRDRTDSSRVVSPLQQAVGAHRIDSTGLTRDEVVNAIVSLVRDAGERV
jgi:cytidylate kinase